MQILRHLWVYFTDGTAKCRRCGLMTVCPGIEDQDGCNG
jgi:hypothetical protein